MPTYSKTQQKWVDALNASGLGGQKNLSLDQIKKISEDSALAFPYWLTNARAGLRVDRGLYVNPETTNQDFTGGGTPANNSEPAIKRIPKSKIASSSAILSGGQSIDDGADENEDDGDTDRESSSRRLPYG